MEIAYHIGAHHTDDDKLLKSILKNSEALVSQGVAVPGPGRYRSALNSARFAYKTGESPAETRKTILEAALGDQDAQRLVMASTVFLSGKKWIFGSGRLYGAINETATAYSQIFQSDQLEIHLGIRNLATFVPAAFASSNSEDFTSYLGAIDLDETSWSQVVMNIRAAAPRAQLTVWCNEDTPLIWSQLIREISGIDPNTQITGGFDLLRDIMSEEGMTRLLDYLKSHPPQTEVQKRRIVAAFLDKFGLDEEIEEELDLPGWDDEMIERLTEAYDEDVYRIERIPGVTFISP